MGHSIPSAFERMYYLETSCQIQVEAMSCGQDLVRINDEVLQRGITRRETRFKEPNAGQRTWDSLIRMLDRDGVTDYQR